jgi:MFS family permease
MRVSNDNLNEEAITAVDEEVGFGEAQPPKVYEDTANRGDGETNEKITLTRTRTNERPTCFKSTMQELLFIFTVTMANASTSFLAGSNQVITNSIGRDLHATPAEITWIGASASLAAGSFLLFFGRVADLFGRKNLFVSSMALFSILALATGFAPSAIFLDTFNGLLGLMSAAAVPPASGILGATYGRPSKRKNYAFACYSAGNPVGFVVGSIASGIVTKLFNWRASYWFLAILYLVFTVTAWFTVPKDLDEPDPLNWAAIKRFDVVGAASTVAGVAMFSSAMTLAGDASQGWKTPYVLVLLILGLCLILFFVYWESVFPSPLMPLHIWRDRTFSLLMLILFLGMMSFPPAQFWLSLYMQRVRRLSPLSVAVRLLPQAIMGILVNIVAGLVMHRVSNKLLMLIGTLCYTASFILLGLLDIGAGDWYWARVFPSILLTVVGADFEFCVVFSYVASSLPRNKQSMAGGILQTMTKLSVVVGLGIGTALFTSNGAVVGDDPLKPYAATFWLSTAASGLSVLMVPFLTLRTQGHKERKRDVEENEKRQEPTSEKAVQEKKGQE